MTTTYTVPEFLISPPPSFPGVQFISSSPPFPFSHLPLPSVAGWASRLLPPERAALGETGLATRGLAEDRGAALADDDGLRVREDGRDGEAAGALDVHEEGAGSRHEGL